MTDQHLFLIFAGVGGVLFLAALVALARVRKLAKEAVPAEGVVVCFLGALFDFAGLTLFPFQTS